MDPVRWKRIKNALADVLEMSDAKSADFIASLESDIRDDVQRLFVADSKSGNFIAHPFGNDFISFSNDNQSATLPEYIDEFRILSLIGIGGMGKVYLAEHTVADSKVRLVAIKLIKHGLDTAAVLRHFVMERQILATLDHPNIARMLDGGATPDGLPYVVMEYVEGDEIRKFTSRKQLSLDQRLELFQKVCEAIASAHRLLIIHRDLKPANILVTESGEPKLLDFGIAKIVSPEWNTGSDELTVTDFRALTPEYASPEQIAGKATTVLTDVYSLGVVLYELLTGRRPHTSERDSTENPLKLSAAAEDSLRSGIPTVEFKLLDGDIANIVLKALARDPNDRYQSVQAFSDDISRFRQGIPTKAAGDFRSQLQKKFIPNIRSIGVAALLLIAVSAVGFYLFSYVKSETRQDKTAENSILRLTNSSQDEQVAGWTNYGISFVKWKDERISESFVMNADGGDQVRLSQIKDLRQGVWSPDGKKVVFWKYNTSAAFIANADGSDEYQVSFVPENVAWSPDGSRIVYQGRHDGSMKLESSELYIYWLDTKKIVRLTENTFFDGDPGWSPDGREIAFISDRDGNYEIYIGCDNGTNVRRLTKNSGHDSFPKFSPDGTQILFNSNIDSETADIYLTDLSGTHTTRLTDWKSNELTRNGWSPDGTKIAFNSDHEGNDEIYIINVEAFRPTLLVSDESANLQTPSYSPDGKSIVYSVQFEDKTGELRVRDITTGNENVLVKTSSSANYPRWSPDGNWVTFHQEVGGKWDVFKIAVGLNSVPVNLSNNPASDSVPSWSNDGTKIYFRSNRNSNSNSSEIFKMNADGSDQTPLPLAEGQLGWCSISPDNLSIVFVADRNGDPQKMSDLYTALLSGGTETQISSRSGNEIQPVFSADGRKIAFVASSDGNQEIYFSNVDGTEPLRVTRNMAADISPAFSPDGKHLLFTSNRSGKFAIYELEL